MSTTSFKRVISHPEELGNLHKMSKSSTDKEQQQQQTDCSMQLPPTTGDAAPAAVVVIEQEEQQQPATLVSTTQAAAAAAVYRGVSTLSDEEGQDGYVYDNQEGESRSTATRPTTAPSSARAGRLRRDSDDKATLEEASSASAAAAANSRVTPVARTQRAGSGSSGTFGWFIDVQGSGEGEKNKKDSSIMAAGGNAVGGVGSAAASGSSSEQPPKSILRKITTDDAHHHHHHGEDDYEEPTQFIDISQQSVDHANPSVMAVTAPNYILEENLSSQMLWKHTAGNRPPQPEEERAYFEMLWRQNFAMSSVDYNVPEEELIEGTSNSPFTDNHFGVNREFSNYSLATDFMATDAEVAEAIERLHGGNAAIGSAAAGGGVDGPSHKPKVVNKKVKAAGSSEDLTVLIKGDNVFGTTVSKSFDRVNPNGNREVDTVNISVASYRVVESKKHGKYAQYLVIYREGGIRDTIGVWKRYSDFEELSRKVVESQDSCSSVLANMSPLAVTEEGDVEHLPNAITSWRLLKKRQRWFRCLDAGYLSLKVFLLERFLHDILFESSSPNLLRDFVIYDTSGVNK